ncbi:arrestin domain-containing protein 2-like isoform X2 [Armigeres subalbatus]|uniref:arrestin domain-containing protein 2-like isoform X2 n=1 Tax=Armigeres subalbatus TaxID=124917 RepID=UPI002ED600F6
MAPNCEIKFDNNPLGIYHSGQTLSGKVELYLDKPYSVNGFRLIINGCAEIEWSEDNNDKRDTYRGTENLLQAETAFIAPSKGPVEIPVGTHVYNFSCVLSPSLPTSFEGNYGKIRYTVCAILDRPWKFNKTCKAAFTVLKPLNLNLDPLMGQPQRADVTKTFCCWPCKSRPLLITVELPAKGYVPGQKIPLTITLNNTSSVALNGVKSSLDRIECYISTIPYEKTNRVHKTLASVSTAVTNDVYSRVTQFLDIPSIAPTGSCSILTIEYELNIIAQVESCRINPKIKIPITIGTVPLMATALPTSSAGTTAQYGSCGEFQQPTAPYFEDNETPPPTYQEATHGVAVNVNDDPHAIGFQPYVPRYPVYRFEHSTPKC